MKQFLLFILFLGFLNNVFAQELTGKKGKYLERYSLFKKKKEAYYDNYQWHGAWTEWDKEGKVVVSGKYKEGKKEGEWLVKRGAYDSVTNYLDGKPHGEALLFRWRTNPLESSYYENGVRHGPYVKRDLTGEKTILEGSFKQGTMDGKWSAYSERGIEQEAYYIGGVLTKRVKYFYQNKIIYKKTEEYYNGDLLTHSHTIGYSGQDQPSFEHFFRYLNKKTLRDSTWTTWQKGKISTSIQYKNDEKHGAERKWDLNGQLITETFYDNGKRNGPVTQFYPNGIKKISGNYEQGKKTGKWIMLYEDGKEMRVETYINGSLDGLVTEWFPGGKKKYELNYSMGYLDGKSTQWDSTGKVLQVRKYKKSEKIEFPFIVKSNKPIVTQDGHGDEKEVVGPLTPTVEEKKNDPDEVYQFAEEMPEFPGGQDALYKYIQQHIKYPEIERESGISGKVFVQFTIDTDGSIINVKILKGVAGGTGLDKEALRVIKSMPKWTPGKMNGKPVKVVMNLPIIFKMN